MPERSLQLRDQAVRDDFAQLILQVAISAKSPIDVSIAIRADFFGECLNLAGYSGLLDGNLQIVSAMSIEELTEAIVEPAQTVKASLETTLVVELINDMKGDPSALPLMQFALDYLSFPNSVGQSGG